jgi:hypothetical protein
MIVMYQINNENQNKEINTARKLKIPILFIYNSVDDKDRDSESYKIRLLMKENLKLFLRI